MSINYDFTAYKGTQKIASISKGKAVPIESIYKGNELVWLDKRLKFNTVLATGSSSLSVTLPLSGYISAHMSEGKDGGGTAKILRNNVALVSYSMAHDTSRTIFKVQAGDKCNISGYAGGIWTCSVKYIADKISTLKNANNVPYDITDTKCYGVEYNNPIYVKVFSPDNTVIAEGNI